MRPTRARIGGALLLVGAAFGLIACEPEPDGRTPWQVTDFPEAPQPATAVVELGKQLFYDPILSIDGQTACGTCHSEFWGMSDALDRSVGQGAGLLAGPGREGPHVMRRNSQALWNLAFREDFFWDGRASSLEEQSIAPILAPDELGRDLDELLDMLDAIPAYQALFAQAFPGDPVVSIEHLQSALADFQRTFVSDSSLYDGHVLGDDWALSDDMRRGMQRFARFRCHTCHVPPLFEGDGYFDRRVPAVAGVDDLGRFEVTHIADDESRFRVPSLRNVAFTEPYFHNGSVAKLEDAVRHELTRSGRRFSNEDVRLITAFVSEALRDESREPQRPDTVPSGLVVPIDGSQVERGTGLTTGLEVPTATP